MSLFSADPELLKLARRVCEATGAPVVGGIPVFLHGYRRTTEDIDLFAADARAVADALTRMGARWDGKSKEFVLEGVPIHLVTEAQTGGPPQETADIRDVRVVGLADLVRFKLKSGLHRPERAQDIADVVALIRLVPLDKRFAARLPTSLRAPFKKLVDAVRKSR
jgi:hypothetical protein